MTMPNEAAGPTTPTPRPDRPSRLDHLVTFVLVGSAPVAAVALQNDADGDLLIVTVLTIAVAMLGGMLVSLLPRVFGVARFTTGGAFIGGMNVIVLLGLPANYARLRDESPHHALTMVTAVLLSYVLVVGTMIVIESRSRRRTDSRVRVRPRYLGAMFAFAVFVLLVFVAVASPLPIVAWLQGVGGRELDSLRDQSFASLQPQLVAYLFGLVRIVVLPFLAAVLTVRAIEGRGLRRWAMAGGVVLLALFATMATVEKSLVPRLVLVVLIATVLAGATRRRPALAVGATVVGIGFPFLIARASNSASTSTVELFEAIVRRVVVLPGEVVFEYFRWTGDNGHLMGATLPYVSKAVPGGTVDIAGEVYDAAFSAGPGVSGHANGAYTAFLWADFGWPGVILGSIFVGLVLVGFERVLRSTAATASGKALRAVVFVQVLQLPSTSVFSALLVFPFGLIDLTIVVLGWHALATRVPRRPVNVEPRPAEVAGV